MTQFIAGGLANLMGSTIMQCRHRATPISFIQGEGNVVPRRAVRPFALRLLWMMSTEEKRSHVHAHYSTIWTNGEIFISRPTRSVQDKAHVL